MRNTCLIVDDLDSVRLFLRAALHDEGFSFIDATNSAEATTLLTDGASDIRLILCDVHMPGTGTGLDFAQFARTWFPSIPVLVITAHCEDDRIRQFESLQKPFSVEALRSRIREMIKADSSVF
jgi:CheY-like chemotaxis protein